MIYKTTACLEREIEMALRSVLILLYEVVSLSNSVIALKQHNKKKILLSFVKGIAGRLSV